MSRALVKLGSGTPLAVRSQRKRISQLPGVYMQVDRVANQIEKTF